MGPLSGQRVRRQNCAVVAWHSMSQQLWRQRAKVPSGDVLCVMVPGANLLTDVCLQQNIMGRLVEKSSIIGSRLQPNGWLWVKLKTEAQALKMWKRLNGARVMQGQYTLNVMLTKDSEWPPVPGFLVQAGEGPTCNREDPYWKKQVNHERNMAPAA